ncbi:MAG: carbon-nitrogen hydrolase family protein [Luteolibacter sp.]
MVRVACIQYQLSEISGFDEFANKVTTQITTAASQKADFVIFPEFFSIQLLSSLRDIPDTEGILRIAREFSAPFIELFSSLASQHSLHIIAGSHPVEEDGKLFNKSFVFDTEGNHIAQPKLHITPFERNNWDIVGGKELVVVKTPKATIGVQICYDVEFPAASQLLANEGIDILFVPYCTDDRQGMLRVRYCCQARTVEHQIYVAAAGLVGVLPGIDSMSAHDAQTAVFTPLDIDFAEDGIAAIANPNIETILFADLDIGALREARKKGTVTPQKDQRHDLLGVSTTKELTLVRHP